MKRLIDVLEEFAPAFDPVPDVTITGLSLDSRRILDGEAFVALAGRRGHGMQHARQALSSGASVVLHDGLEPPPQAIADRCVTVDGLADHLAPIARRFFDDPARDMDLIAVTGTNGKSSVAWLLAQALGGAMIGTLGIGKPGNLAPTTHTTPDLFSLYRALRSLRQRKVSTVVIEASSHALEQGRLSGLAFSTAIFTNLGHDHLDYHGTSEAYGAAKARLFRDYTSRRQLINIDDSFGRTLAAEQSGSPGLLTYGLDRAWGPDVIGDVRSADLNGLVIDITTPDGRVSATSSLLGRVNAHNLIIVASELASRGVHADDIVEMLRALTPVPGRMNRVDGPGGQSVVIDYAHTPDALETALNGVRELCPGRVLCVFGCGGDRDRAKRPLMGRVAESLADRVFLTDDNPRFEDGLAIVREIQGGMARPDRSCVVRDRAEAIRRAIVDAGPGDVVLVAGKGHEREQVIGDQAHPFSDFEAVRSALTEAA